MEHEAVRGSVLVSNRFALGIWSHKKCLEGKRRGTMGCARQYCSGLGAFVPPGVLGSLGFERPRAFASPRRDVYYGNEAERHWIQHGSKCSAEPGISLGLSEGTVVVVFFFFIF